MISVVTNMAALQVQNGMKVNTDNKKKSTEKLSSGYRINRAADDAAGLTISQKLRSQVRSLNQGANNGQDGASWVRIGDGTLEEVHDMIHRMNELTVKSLNDTNTDADRAAIQQEFDNLQSEIDRITDSSEFNTKKIFSEHEPTYYQCEGNAEFDNTEVHSVYVPKNTLVVTYKLPEAGSETEKQVSITVPEGEYTTQELADEIEDAIFDSEAKDDGLYMSLTGKGTFNLNLEGGTKISAVEGGLSYLLYDSYSGGAVGCLIGTTVFPDDNARLYIESGRNDEMTFDIEDFSGNKTEKTIKLSSGSYNRDELIDIINSKLSDTSIRATKHGTGIMLGSDEAIISRFKGNMFQIDDARYTSVFYDNVSYGKVDPIASSFTGGAVLDLGNYRDQEHQNFNIKAGVNDTLVFKANGSSTPVSIKLPAQNYNITSMVNTLNSQFSSNGLALRAELYNQGDYYGLKINSTIKGVNSDVGLDPASSAYDTLFVNRSRNVYANDVVYENEVYGRNDVLASFTGGKPFESTQTARYDNLPLEVKSGINDSFSLKVDNSTYEITVPAGNYGSTQGLVNALNTVFGSDTLGSHRGQIEVLIDPVSGSLSIQAKSLDTMIGSINASEIPGNTGYADLFTDSVAVNNIKKTGNTYVSERVFAEPCAITSADNKVTIHSTDNKASYTISLPTGSAVSHADIVSSINNAPQSSVYSEDIVFSDYAVPGYDRGFDTKTGVGSTQTYERQYNASGTTEAGQEGMVGSGHRVDTPATVNISMENTQVTLDSSNNSMSLTLNNVTKTITLDAGTYDSTSLASAMNEKIRENFGSYFGSATVTPDGSYGIKITSILDKADGDKGWGADTNISCSTASSPLIAELSTNRYQATVHSDAILKDSITISSDMNIFKFTYNGSEKSIVLDNGTYNRNTMLEQLNSKLDAAGIPVTASADTYVYSAGSVGFALTLKADNAGDGYSIGMAYNASSGSANEALFGPMNTPAQTTSSGPIKESITIDPSATKFRFTLNGTEKSVDLTAGSYDRNSFISMLNGKMSGAKASINDAGYLTLTSDGKGSGNSVRMTYDSSADSAMRAIWGTRDSVAPEVTASFDSSDHLILTGKDGRQFTIASYDSDLLDSTTSSSTGTPETKSGYTSTIHASMDGVDLNISSSNPLVIDNWNNNLNFQYYRGTEDQYGTAFRITVPNGTYTSYGQLQTALQSSLDASVGTGELTATVNSKGVHIEAVKSGSERAIGTYGRYYRAVDKYSENNGDFYEKVMCSTKTVTEKQGVSSVHGSNFSTDKDQAYTIGRKNVRTQPAKIVLNLNDTLTLDFETPLGTHTFSMKLDPGTWQGKSLTDMIQKKLNDQLKAAGYPENMIEVDTGRISNNVAGSDNANALNFILSDSMNMPAGKYVIDGIGGNAAFSVFYQTEGDLIPAYIMGAKDLRGGITVEDGKNVLSFTTDGNDYEFAIEPGEYTGSELTDKINDQLTAQNAPVRAELDDSTGALKLSQKKMGNHPITDIGGSAKSSLMYNENGRISDDKGDIDIQMSGVYDDVIKIERPRCDSTSLGINTITVTKRKYAEKALGRLSEALNKVSSIRSKFGAEQNRLEYAIAINQNSAENTDAADSRLADTDMSGEIVKLAKHNIVQQAAEAMLTQANNTTQGVLTLLR